MTPAGYVVVQLCLAEDSKNILLHINACPCYHWASLTATQQHHTPSRLPEQQLWNRFSSNVFSINQAEEKRKCFQKVYSESSKISVPKSLSTSFWLCTALLINDVWTVTFCGHKSNSDMQTSKKAMRISEWADSWISNVKADQINHESIRRKCVCQGSSKLKNGCA